MTIKQQGGIFGRNPTFNDVDVEGTLTVDGLPITGGNGSMAAQDANAVAITGGNIDGTVIGATTKANISGLASVFSNLAVNTSTLVVDSISNRVGIGTTSPLTLLHATLPAGVNGDIASLGRAANSYQFKLGMTSGSMFYVADNSSSILLGFPYSGGITFNGDTAAANALDDYEQGVWSPVISDATSGGNTGTATVAYATYTKIGDVVHLKARLLNINTTGMGTGNLYIQGLPFAASGDNDGISTTSLFTAAANSLGVFPSVDNGASCLKLKEVISGGVYINADTAQFASGTADIWITITYNAG